MPQRPTTLVHALLLTTTAALQRVVLYVDPCKGDALVEIATISQKIAERGAAVVPIWSEAMATRMTDDEMEDGVLQAPPPGEEVRWAASMLPEAQVDAVICGSDGGLACAERLQDALLPERSNGTRAL